MARFTVQVPQHVILCNFVNRTAPNCTRLFFFLCSVLSEIAWQRRGKTMKLFAVLAFGLIVVGLDGNVSQINRVFFSKFTCLQI